MSTADEGGEAAAPVAYEFSRSDLLLLTAAVIASFVLIQAIGLSLVSVSEQSESLSDPEPVENESSAAVSVAAVVYILVGTAVAFLLIKFKLELLIKGVIIVAVYSVGAFYGQHVLASGASGPPAWLATNGAGLVLAAALVKAPRWWVLNGIGILWGGLIIGLGGQFLRPLAVIGILVLLLVYDAVAVYGTQHMQALVDGLSGLRLPIMITYPLSLSYALPEDVADAADAPALHLGLGDLVAPSVLVVSAAVFSPASTATVGPLALNLPAIGAAVGTAAGVVVLLRLRGQVHAGLPPLNVGAIGGYAAACLLAGVTLFP